MAVVTTQPEQGPGCVRGGPSSGSCGTQSTPFLRLIKINISKFFRNFIITQLSISIFNALSCALHPCMYYACRHACMIHHGRFRVLLLRSSQPAYCSTLSFISTYQLHIYPPSNPRFYRLHTLSRYRTSAFLSTLHFLIIFRDIWPQWGLTQTSSI